MAEIRPSKIDLSNENLKRRTYIKTDDLVPGTKYKILYMKKITGQFGPRVQVTLEDHLYDLPANFLIQLAPYDLHTMDYRGIYLNYIGRKQDYFKTIIMKLEGMPYVPNIPTIMPAEERVDSRTHRFFDRFKYLHRQVPYPGESKKPTASTTTPNSSHNDDEIPYHLVCKICLCRRKDSILLKCGHASICQICSKGFLRKPCPFCRAKVTQIKRVFD